MSDIAKEATSEGLFTRTSSGLVRTVSTFDAFYYNAIQVNFSLGFFIVAALVFYPGADYGLSTILAIAGSLLIGLTYALFGSVYPRSGAEYVPLSRVLHPLLGFTGSFGNVLWMCFYFGAGPAWAATLALAPFLVVLGLQTGNQGLVNAGFWLDTPAGWITIGVILIVISSLLLYRGMAFYFRLQRWFFSFSLIGFAVLLLVFLLGGMGVFDFQAAFDKYAGAGTYNEMIDLATADGVNLSPPFSLRASLNFMIWTTFTVLFGVWSTSFGGEIKDVKRGQLMGILLAQLVMGILLLLLGYLAIAAIGERGLLAIDWVSMAKPEEFPLAYPWLSTLGTIMADNILVTILVFGAIITMYVVGLPVIAIYTTRGMLAWAIDGLAPEWLGKVSDRYHTPVNAIITTAVLGVAFLILFSFVGWAQTIAGQVTFGIVFILMSIAAAIFPYTKRELYERTPARLEVAGIPLMSISGVLGAIFMAWIVYRTLVDTSYGSNTTATIVLTIVAIGGGVLWFLIAREIRRRQGMDVDARFEEIPIE